MTEHEFLVPDLGEGLEEATLSSWLVAVGEQVELNQPLCLLETAKAEVEIPSPYAGSVLERRGEPGDVLAVGSLLARIGTTSSDTDASSEPPVAEASAQASDRAPTLVGYGVDEDGDRSRRAPAAAEPTATKPLAKPPVRKLARTLGVDLTALHPGSGPGGVITRADVTGAAGAPPDAPRSGESQADAEATVVPVRGIRATIAERMSTSRNSIPDAHCAVEVDCARLLEVRSRLNTAAANAGNVITPFALILRLLVGALREHPLLNATFEEHGPQIRTFSQIHLGVGVAIERGLLVPVVRDAGELGTLALAEEVTRLAAGARSGSLRPAELSGSTFTVSNFGAFGLDEGVPVINYPEAAIVGIGSIKPRPVVRDDELVVRPTATITCAFDHRVCDGAEAGAFLGQTRELIENPELALLRS